MTAAVRHTHRRAAATQPGRCPVRRADPEPALLALAARIYNDSTAPADVAPDVARIVTGHRHAEPTSEMLRLWEGLCAADRLLAAQARAGLSCNLAEFAAAWSTRGWYAAQLADPLPDGFQLPSLDSGAEANRRRFRFRLPGRRRTITGGGCR